MRNALQLPEVKSEPIIFAGGLDSVTPPFSLAPGFCRAAQNFECSIFGGYRRIPGYERFDGRTKPSDATYAIVAATSITGGAVGNTLTGSTSGATGQIIAITGTYFVVTLTVGTYQAENLNVGAGTIAVSTGAGVIGGAATPKLNAQYKNLAADVYRALIAAPTGSGSILGGFLFEDDVYCFRNNAGGTAAGLFKESTSGWSAVALGRELKFTGGTSTTVADGATLTGASSGASAVVRRQAIRTGTIAGSNAAGSFVFATVTGAFTNGENLQVGGVTKAVANGVDAAITLLPGGRYETVKANFGGSTTTKRVYGCDGVNRAFEFDGTVFVPITTGMTTDAPDHIAAHVNHLFLSFGASVQFSSVGSPYFWAPLTGATELAMGDDVTGFAVQPASSTSGSLAIFTTGKMSVLYGTGSASWSLLPFRDEFGAMPWTIQNLSQTMFLDAQGLTNIATVQAYGNFSYATFSNRVKDTLNGWRITAIASCISRDLSQYRLFFSNGYALYVTFNGNKVVGIMPMLFLHTVSCSWSDKMADGSEVIFFGATDGKVYQMDRGTSFDGSAIEAYINLAYNFSKSARTAKLYRDAALEISGNGYAEYAFGYSLAYGATDTLQPTSQTLVTSFSSRMWDAGYVWEVGVWDGVTLMPSTMSMDGEGENVSVAITSNEDYFDPFTVSGGVINYTPRRTLRAA